MTLNTKMQFCHDFMVVIDTNRFEDYNKESQISPYCACKTCHEFFEERNKRSYISMGQYYITTSVFNEIVQQRKEELDKAKKELKRAQLVFGISNEISLEYDFEQELKNYLDIHHIKVLPNPPNDVFPRIIERAFQKKLPFKILEDKYSDKGFKDVLLWESLLNFDYESKRIGKVFFLTANLKDFPVDGLLPEWKKYHESVELSILQNWQDFIIEERIIAPELFAQNNIYYSAILDLFQGENPDIVELPNFKKKITGRKESSIVEVETDVKERNGKLYSAKYFYDIKINEATLIDPEENDS